LTERNVLFLDANVLFSAAYSPESRLRALWDATSIELVTSHYAIEEARRNLPRPEQRERLEKLLRGVRQVHEADPACIPEEMILPEKDRPIIAAAIASGATHLITGDRAHFGVWYGKEIGGVLILPPAEYVERRRRELGH
jgi:predicted nucleic acid-binding protein